MGTKLVIFLNLCLIFACCASEKDKHADNKNLLDTTFIATPDSLNGKAISFYLVKDELIKEAKLYFYDSLQIADNDETINLIDQISSAENELRPFYFHLLCKMVLHHPAELDKTIADALVLYSEMYTCDFFQYFKDNNNNTLLQVFAKQAFLSFAIEDQTVGTLQNYKTEMEAGCPENYKLQKPVIKLYISYLDQYLKH